MKIFVGNVNFTATEDAIRKAFEPFGAVVRVDIPVHKDTQRPRGFAFVTMRNQAEANTAIASLDGVVIEGRPVRVQPAVSKDRKEKGQAA